MVLCTTASAPRSQQSRTRLRTRAPEPALKGEELLDPPSAHIASPEPAVFEPSMRRATGLNSFAAERTV